jgi:hypothetical protein
MDGVVEAKYDMEDAKIVSENVGKMLSGFRDDDGNYSRLTLKQLKWFVNYYTTIDSFGDVSLAVGLYKTSSESILDRYDGSSYFMALAAKFIEVDPQADLLQHMIKESCLTHSELSEMLVAEKSYLEVFDTCARGRELDIRESFIKIKEKLLEECIQVASRAAACNEQAAKALDLREEAVRRMETEFLRRIIGSSKKRVTTPTPTPIAGKKIARKQ